jgi:hypothetical protein
MALTDARSALREAFVVGFAVFVIVLGGAALYQYAATAGSLLVLVGLLLALGYLLYAWAL